MNKPETVWNKVVIFFILILIIILLHYVNILKPVEGLITKVFSPVQVPLYRISLFFSNQELLQEKEKLISDKEELNNKINNLINDNTKLKDLLDKNTILIEQIGFLEDNNYEYQPAQIINRFSENDAQIIIVNQGKNKNIEPGMAVVAKEGILVGKVIEVDSNTARILLVTSNLSRVGAIIQNEENTPGLVTGEHGLSLSMELIPKEDKINSRQVVITSGIEEKVPKGLIIGNIDVIDESAGDLFNSAIINPLIDYNNLSIVSIILL